MKPLSHDTFQLIQQLYQSSGLLEKFLGKPEKTDSLLERIEKSTEPLAIPYLLLYILTHTKADVLAAARAIHNLINQLSAAELIGLDEQVRLNSYDYPDIWGWKKIQPEDLADLNHLQSYQEVVLGVSSFHNNGFVREQAVQKLGNIWTGKELPFLLIRLNDWVSNVQQVAFTAVTARLQPNYAFYFVDFLPIVLRLSQWSRIDHSFLVNAIKKLLQTESSHPALLYGLKSQDQVVRRACFQIALEASTINFAEIIELGSKDEDNLIRIWSVQKIRTLTGIGEVEHLLDIFCADSYMRARQEAFRIYVEKYPERAPEKLRQALLDSHSSIRYEVQYHQRKNGMDCAAFYRNALTQGNAIYSAISGLGETGKDSDEMWILPYINHPLTRIRRVSIKALAKLNPKTHMALFLQALFDPSGSVSREAMKALELNGHLLNPQCLWKNLENASQAHTKKNILSLISHLSKWESILYLIQAAASQDEWISNPACQKINDWHARFNRSFIYPTVSQKMNLIKLLAENGDKLNIHIREEIENIVNIIPTTGAFS